MFECSGIFYSFHHLPACSITFQILPWLTYIGLSLYWVIPILGYPILPFRRFQIFPFSRTFHNLLLYSTAFHQIPWCPIIFHSFLFRCHDWVLLVSRMFHWVLDYSINSLSYSLFYLMFCCVHQFKLFIDKICGLINKTREGSWFKLFNLVA
jgi:hypothetical protein